MVQDPRQAKVAQFDILLDVEEDVGWFQVPMKDCGPAVTPPVTLLQGQRELGHDSQDELLLQIAPVKVKKTHAYTDEGKGFTSMQQSVSFSIQPHLSLMQRLMRLDRSPPSQYSMTMYRVVFVRSMMRS